MAEAEDDSRLEIAHVLFTDIVGYSKLLTNEQRELLQLLNEIVRGTQQFRAAEAADKLVRLPTGDGMALAFFTNPDAPVRCAREISRQLRPHPQLHLRMGINSGPVEHVSDVNDRRNVAGAGINMAQRVMDCGDAGHILIAKRVADDLSHFAEWQPSLHSLGEVEVKHGVKVDVVNFYGDGFGNPAIPNKISQAEGERLSAEAHAVRRKRQRILILASTLITLLAILGIGYWIWERRAALASAYNVGAAGIIEKSIAVLPFENFAQNSEDTYLAEGVQDDILTDLSKVAGLKVISRRSVAQYRGSTLDVREIGKALQVAHVLEGSVRRIAGKIHVTAQLIETRTDTQMWAEKYDRDLADLLSIQSEISQVIATKLKVVLSPGEKAAIEEKPTQDQEAYDLYLRARSLVHQFSATKKVAQADIPKAVTLLEAAIARDPKFTLAYCLLSEAQLSLYALEYWNRERLPKAKEAIETALRIAPDSGEAHLAFATYLYFGTSDFTGAEKELAIAAGALPGRGEVANLGGVLAEIRGDWPKALRERNRALELDPRNEETAADLITLYTNLRRYAEAQKVADHMIATIPQQSSAYFWRQKNWIELARGDTNAAMAALDSSPSRHAGLSGFNTLIAQVFYLQREYDKAEEILRSAEDVARAQNVFPKGGENARGFTFEKLARIARVQGKPDKVREYLDGARQALEKWLAQNPEQASIIEARALAYIAECDAGLGRKEEAMGEVRHALEVWPLSRDAIITPEIAQILAVAYIWAGERDAALKLLQEFAKSPYGPTAGDLALNPVWDEIRSDPRFGQIVEETKMPLFAKRD